MAIRTRGAHSQRIKETAIPHQILLLPGLLCDDAVWTHARAALAPTPCVIADFGDLATIAGMARHALATLWPGRWTVVGHSMGGRVALEIARQAPERLESLVLLDTGVDAIAPGEAGALERRKRYALLARARASGMRAMGEEWARGMVHPDRIATPVFQDILAMIERKTPDIFAAQIEALLGRPDAQDVLRTLACPLLLVCGRQDMWSPLERHERMRALQPRAQLVVVEDSGHMTTMEQPDAVADILRTWMTR